MAIIILVLKKNTDQNTQKTRFDRSDRSGIGFWSKLKKKYVYKWPFKYSFYSEFDAQFEFEIRYLKKYLS
jgi:hypothetical protein